MIFGEIFWKSLPCETICGAIPSALLRFSTAVKNGFASFRKHVHARLKNSTLLTSTSVQYLQFLFTTRSNEELRRASKSMFFNYGCEHSHSGPSGLTSREINSKWISEDVEARGRVRELSACFRGHTPNYFFSTTCNTKKHPGVRPMMLAAQEILDSLDEVERQKFADVVQVHDQIVLLHFRYIFYDAGNELQHCLWIISLTGTRSCLETLLTCGIASNFKKLPPIYLTFIA
jgi:hypothetical protein